MTYPENRTPLQLEDLAKLHPSTWQAECEQLRAQNTWLIDDRDRAVAEAKALRARVATLEEALKRLIDTAEQCDLQEWAGFHLDQARAALEAKP